MVYDEQVLKSVKTICLLFDSLKVGRDDLGPNVWCRKVINGLKTANVILVIRSTYNVKNDDCRGSFESIY